MRILFILSVALLVVSCTRSYRGPVRSVGLCATPRAVVTRVRAPAGVPDRRISLDQHLITDTPAARPFTYDDALPSGATALERAWHGMPPTVPHGIQDLLPITREENACLECHDPTNPDREAEDGKPIPKSHFMDLRKAPPVQTPHVVGARYNCVLCHQQRTDAKPLIQNRYKR